ncbi:AfsR family transcriptional regulator OS=Streptomyces microflavus OX=1919 GN=G3I39_17795 PE=3 SV=1 [Streptomyces microflavus]
MSAARALLGSTDGDNRDRVVHGCGGYRLRIDEGELDTLRFRSLARAGRDAGERGDLRTAARLLREALDLWEGPPLNDLRDSTGVAEEAERLEARCLTVYEDWAETEIELGRAAVAVDGLRDLVERHPLRERLRAAWMNSLHQSGRQAEALAVYDDYRLLLARELGLEPSPAMAALYRAMLGRGRAPPAPGGRPGHRARCRAARRPQGLHRSPRGTAGRLALLGSPDERVVVVPRPAGSGKSRWPCGRPHLLGDGFPTGGSTSRSGGRTARPVPAVQAGGAVGEVRSRWLRPGPPGKRAGRTRRCRRTRRTPGRSGCRCTGR